MLERVRAFDLHRRLLLGDTCFLSDERLVVLLENVQEWLGDGHRLIHKFNIKIFKQDIKLKKNSFNFLKKLINNKTIVNYPGTGGVKKMISNKNEKEYKNKILKIINLFDDK